MKTSIRYRYDESDYRWPIPFVFQNPAQLGVSLVDATGQEKRLYWPNDFRLEGNILILPVPVGCQLNIWLAAAGNMAGMAAGSLAGNATGFAAATGPVYDPISGEICAPISAQNSALAGQVSAGQVSADQAADSQLADLAAAVKQAKQAAEAAAAEAERAIATASASQESIAELKAVQAKAEASQKQARKIIAALQAGASPQDLEEAVRMAKAYAELAQKEAWHTEHDFWQISNLARRPGISVLKCHAQLAHCASGTFIVNPGLTHAPTPFYGVWPIAKKEDIKWDGFFFTGHECGKIPPPEYPDYKPDGRPPSTWPPVDDDDDSEGSWWLPCDHHDHF